MKDFFWHFVSLALSIAALFSVYFLRKKESPAAEITSAETNDAVRSDDTNEIQAAIGLALHLYLNEQHDYEKTILTIQKVIRPYSPWSSKIYMLRRCPRT